MPAGQAFPERQFAGAPEALVRLARGERAFLRLEELQTWPAFWQLAALLTGADVREGAPSNGGAAEPGAQAGQPSWTRASSSSQSPPSSQWSP